MFAGAQMRVGTARDANAWQREVAALLAGLWSVSDTMAPKYSSGDSQAWFAGLCATSMRIR